jgi:hypothetical protein
VGAAPARLCCQADGSQGTGEGQAGGWLAQLNGRLFLLAVANAVDLTGIPVLSVPPEN